MVLGAQFAFGNGAVVGVEHDADNLAFVGWTGWRCAAGSSREQSGQERILLAHRFVGNDGDLAVAWSGHEGDCTRSQFLRMPLPPRKGALEGCDRAAAAADAAGGK
jgi:hypothetical protein